MQILENRDWRRVVTWPAFYAVIFLTVQYENWRFPNQGGSDSPEGVIFFMLLAGIGGGLIFILPLALLVTVFLKKPSSSALPFYDLSLRKSMGVCISTILLLFIKAYSPQSWPSFILAGLPFFLMFYISSQILFGRSKGPRWAPPSNE